MKDQLDGLKEWKCENGHVLGVVQRVRVSGAQRKFWVSQLMLYRYAIDPAAEEPGTVDVIGPVVGDAGPFKCDICEARRRWAMGEDALERLMDLLAPSAAPPSATPPPTPPQIGQHNLERGEMKGIVK